jgi:hypothetical protein
VLRRKGKGHQTRINDILSSLLEAEYIQASKTSCKCNLLTLP